MLEVAAGEHQRVAERATSDAVAVLPSGRTTSDGRASGAVVGRRSCGGGHAGWRRPSDGRWRVDRVGQGEEHVVEGGLAAVDVDGVDAGVVEGADRSMRRVPSSDGAVTISTPRSNVGSAATNAPSAPRPRDELGGLGAP